MSLTWLLRPRRHPGPVSRDPRRIRTKLRVEELEKRELLDAASGMRPPIRQAGPLPVFDQSNFISGLYYDLLHRQPQQAEVMGWNLALGTGASKAQVVQGFENSDEYLLDMVQGDYQTFLGRNADPTGTQAWLEELKQGASPQDVMASFVASNEYFQKQGGTLQGWVNALYRDLLGRPADAPGLAVWVQRLQNGLPRSNAALAFVHSQEENVQLVAGVYENLLGRAPDAPGLQYWVAALGKGLTLAQLNSVFATSAESLNLQQSIDYLDTGGIGGTGNTQNSNGGTLTTGVDHFDNKAQTAATLTVGQNVDINRETGDQTEETVAVDPNNPRRIFVAANENNLMDGEMAAFSTDGGATWTPYVIGTGPLGDGLPLNVGDPWASWDQFGNLFFTYVSETSINSNQFFLTVLLSTDGGKTFSLLTSTIAINDHPEVTTGAGEVAVTFNVGSPRTPAGQIGVALANVTGLGQVGPFFELLVPNSDAKNFGDIAIGPAGQIVAAFQGNTTGPGPDAAQVSLDPNVLGSAQFGNPMVASKLNVGAFRPITPQPARNVTANIELAYDLSKGPHRGRLYLAYADAQNITTNSLNIFVRFSDDNGMTWSRPIQVNDDSGNAVHFMPALAVDQTTGNVAVAWYDTRNDTGSSLGARAHKLNTDVETFASVSTDGGVSFAPNVQVASGPSNATLNMDTIGNDFGDYLGLGYSHGILYPAWADNSTTLAGNPNRPNFDIAFAQVLGPGGASTGGGNTGGGTTGGGTFVPRPPDRFDPNETSDQAFLFGIASAGTQTIPNLLISRLPNGQIDNNWWRWQAGKSGTFTVQINYQAFNGGDLNLRLFTLDSQNHLVQLGISQRTGVTSQKVSVAVAAGEPLYAWVFGFNHAEAAYQMTVTLG